MRVLYKTHPLDLKLFEVYIRTLTSGDNNSPEKHRLYPVIRGWGLKRLKNLSPAV